MKKNPLLAFGILIALACLQTAAPGSVQASFCSVREDSLQAADIIFSGKVVSITHAPQDDVVLFHVGIGWKGMSESQVIINTGGSARDCGIGNCGYHFEAGKSYLVFAYDWSQSPPVHRTDNGQTVPIPFLVTDKCSRTGPLALAGQDIAALGPGSLPIAGASFLHRLPDFLLYLLVPLLLVAVGFRLRQVSRAGRKQPSML